MEKLIESFHCMWTKEAFTQKVEDVFKIHLYNAKKIHTFVTTVPRLSVGGRILTKIPVEWLESAS